MTLQITLLTCHVAMVFCFCSSLQQWLPSAFPSGAVALWTELSIVASQTSPRRWQYSKRSVFLFLFYLILFLYSVCTFTWRTLSVGENIVGSIEFLPYFFPLFYAWLFCVWCPLIFEFAFFSGNQFSLVTALFASLVNARTSVCDSRRRWAFPGFFPQW